MKRRFGIPAVIALPLISITLHGCGPAAGIVDIGVEAANRAAYGSPLWRFSSEAAAWLDTTVASYDEGAAIPRKYRAISDAEGYVCLSDFPADSTLVARKGAMTQLRYAAVSEGADGVINVHCGVVNNPLDYRLCWSRPMVCRGSLVAWSDDTAHDRLQDIGVSLESFSVSPDKSKLYVYRNEFTAYWWPVPVAFDGKIVGLLTTDTYVVLEVTPGVHDLASISKIEGRLSLDAAPGKIYFVEVSTRMQQIYALGMQPADTTMLELVDENWGRRTVRQSQRLRAYL